MQYRSFVFRSPSRIVFGDDTSKRLPEFVKESNPKRVLFVTDKVLCRLGIADAVITSIDGLVPELSVFDRVEPEPSIQNAQEIADTAREKDFDLVIGLGGGSVLDMAKIASIATTNLAPIRDLIGVDRIPKPGVKKILMPTTSGTGSEITMNAIVKLDIEPIKTGLVSPFLLADIAIVDPCLTTTMPPAITSATGLDALSHAIESLMSIDSNPITEALGLQAVKLIFSNLVKAYQKGDDMNARRNMSLASLSAAMSFGNAGVCAGHALAYAFAVKCGTSHGVSCALALPYIMEYNATTCARVLNLIAESIAEKTFSQNVGFFNTVKAVRELITKLGVPLSLKELNIKKNQIPQLAQDLLKSQRLLVHNPRPINIQEAETIFNRMYEGTALSVSTYGKKV